MMRNLMMRIASVAASLAAFALPLPLPLLQQ